MTDQHIPAAILMDAVQAVSADRPNTHGDAHGNFAAIAILWNAYLDAMSSVKPVPRIEPVDVAQMMVLFKVARTISGDPTVPDHYVDQAGYSSMAARLAGADPAPPAAVPQQHPFTYDQAIAPAGPAPEVAQDPWPRIVPLDEHDPA